MLKNASEAFAFPLTLIFRESLASSQLPIQFRSANKTLFFKKGDKTVAANYRPVSLTSDVCKILEVDVVLLDFAKAFNTVPHNRQLLKLRAYGIDGLVLKWIASFFTNRRQRVVKGDIVSNWVEVFSDTIKIVSKSHADDPKILSIVKSDLCVKEIQSDLNKAFKWTQDWLLKFNINKCVVMHYGSTNKNYPLFINGIQLHDSKSERGLGLTFSANLKMERSSN
ncbi:uncharacterized protein LOC136073916 [Hydra vulgaris]|uniref:uncharacterized protein LOC136073916 n=1 Tax=Hydra vulgaris TaxID=6087 RepID=UPI0032EA4405